MSRSLSGDNPTLTSAFHTALLHQLIALAFVAAVLAVAWNVLRSAQYRKAVSEGRAAVVVRSGDVGPEALGRKILRIGFGILWIADGLLQVQSGMVLRLPTTVLRPAAAGSPGWVNSLVNVAVTTWTKHPVQAATSAVWIQVGIGIFLLVAPRGRWSRAAGLASVVWALVVWIFGEAFGAIFAPGLTVAFGAPGAALFYAVGGGLVALPERSWRGPRLGRVLTAVMGAFFLGMAVLQAWPGRGFWQGSIGHSRGTLSAMVNQMSATPQPAVLSRWVSSFAGFDTSHGWGVNLFLVASLAAIGLAFLSGRPRLVVAGLGVAAVVCLADWVLVEDLGFLGGVGTDPNSMLPLLLLSSGSVAALVRQPASVPVALGAPAEPAHGSWWQQLAPGYAGRVMAAIAAVVVVAVGALPMAAASANSTADPLLSEALDGPPTLANAPAPTFTLTDQHGRTVSLSSLRGKAVALTFLDPVCTVDCPIIAQEFRQADAMLGGSARQVDFVAVVANPIYNSLAATQAFDRQEGLAGIPNWLYLTGSTVQLEKVWSSYGVQVSVTPAGSMVDHSDVAFVIDPRGQTREVLDTAPGTTGAESSSFSSLLTNELQNALAG
jgi:cytochrome oxidase Cu insertion factor (SCO1/SenC/PrrC family)